MSNIPKNAHDVRPIKDERGRLLLDRTKPFDGTCSDCGQIDDLRPYGRGGAWVCFDCAMKDEKEAERQFLAILEPKP